MNEVTVITSDGKIWNLQQTIFNIIAVAKTGPVRINLLHEGPCCVSVGLEDLLDQVCALLKVDIDHFIIYTSNQLSSSKYKQHRTPFVELNKAKESIKSFIPSTLEKTFGLFIGRSNADRLRIASYLYKHHRDKSSMTFHYDPTSDFHTSNFGLEKSIEKSWNDRHQVFDFLDHVPIKFKEHTYPILWNKEAFELADQYQHIFCDIVCETYTSGKSFFVTEKTLRAIINYCPFIVQGPRHYLTNLTRLGFQTFYGWWDESYDTDYEDARYDGIVCNIEWIAQQDKNKLKSWRKDMQPILEHNVNVLRNLTHEKITQTEFYYD